MNHEEDDERRLVDRARRGDVPAFGRLVEAYMRRAYFTALALCGSRDDAWDLSQDAFVRAFRAIRRFDPDRAAFFTWYYRILRNLYTNHERSKSRRRRFLARFRNGASPLESPREPSALCEANERQEKLWSALQRLNAKDREVIVLKDLQGLEYRRIAEMMGCPPGTVMSRLYHARKRLRRRMEVDHEP